MEDADSFLESVQNNDIKTIEQIISRNKNILKHQYPTSNQTILSKACKDEQVKAETLKILLEKSEKYDIQELFKTVTDRGYHDKVALLIEKKNVEIDTEILCWTIKYSNEKESGMCNFDKCSNIILDKLESQENYRVNINAKDKLGHTPLHYSLRYCDNKKSMRLLKLGASLACRNRYGNLPIKHIESDFLKEFLDSCITETKEDNPTTNLNEKYKEEKYFQVVIDYQNLIPPKTKNTENARNPTSMSNAQRKPEDIEMSLMSCCRAQPETGDTKTNNAKTQTYKAQPETEAIEMSEALIPTSRAQSETDVTEMSNATTKTYEAQPETEAIEMSETLIPISRAQSETDVTEMSNATTKTYEAQPETEAIEYISKAPEFRSLITHPVVMSFLLMKWHQIRHLFYINLIFYCLFLISLNFYISNYYSKLSFVRPSISSGLPFVILVILHSTFWVLVLRELSQMVISTKLYFRDYDNVVEIILIFVSGIILYVDFFDYNRRIISSIAILLSAYEFLIMGGQNMHFATYVVMFQTVTKNFLKLLLLYSVLIISFAITFHILFATTYEESETNKHYKTAITTNDNSTFETLMEQNFSDQDDRCKCSSESTNVFKNPYYSIFKTIFMLTGEFNSDSLNFNTYPTASRIIICLFVFTISITLLNLLNGLAVSDTQKIQNDAKLVGYVALARRIYYVESMLFSKLMKKNIPFKFLDSIVKYSCIFTSSEPLLFICPNLNRTVSTAKKTHTEIEAIDDLPWYKFYYYFSCVRLDTETNQKIFPLIKSNDKKCNQ